MTEWENRWIAALVVIVLVFAFAIVFGAPAHGRACYWSERFDKGCRNQGIYLTKKKPPAPVVVQLGKGKPCDPRGCPNG